jgi:hypothetical protein
MSLGPFTTLLIPSTKNGKLQFWNDLTQQIIEADFSRPNIDDTSGAGVWRNGVFIELAEDDPDWDDSDGCPVIKMRPQLANLERYGSFDANWAPSANFTESTAPIFGDADGIKLVCNSDSNGVDYSLGLDAGSGVFALSIGDTLSINFIVHKSGTNTVFAHYIGFSGTGEIACAFDVSDLSVDLQYGAKFENESAEVVALGNDYYLCHYQGDIITNDATAISTQTVGFGIGTSAQSAGDEGSFYSLTLCEGATSSIIPTTTNFVTRAANAFNFDGLVAKELSSSTDGVSFITKVSVYDPTCGVFDFFDSANNRVFYFAVNSGMFLVLNSVLGGGSPGNMGSAQTINVPFSFGFTFNVVTKNLSVFLDGAKIGTYTTTITDVDNIRNLANFGFSSKYSHERSAFTPLVLTDAEMIAALNEL